MEKLGKYNSNKVFERIYQLSDDPHNNYTPLELCDQMLDKIPELGGDILVMFNLEFLYKIKERINNLEDVWFITPCEKKALVAEKMGTKRNHIRYYSYKDKEVKGIETMPKFDVVVGNPPFQPPVKRGGPGTGTGTGNILWDKFVEMGFESCKDGGIIALITPDKWRSSSLTEFSFVKKSRELLWSNHLLDIFPANDYFNVGGVVNMDAWIAKKEENKNSLGIPEIFKKIKYFPLNYKDPEVNEYLEDAYSGLDEENFIMDIPIHRNRSYNMSKEKTKVHQYPHFNTMAQYKKNQFDWYDQKTEGYDDKKVIISWSGGIDNDDRDLAVYNSGGLGTGSHGTAFSVESEEEGKNLVNFLNHSKIIRKILLGGQKQRGFGVLAQILKRIPKSWVERFNSGEDL